MFDFFFKCLSSLASFAFPVFASYKALQHDDITLIKPWLMYWIVVAIQLTAESYLGFLLAFIPLFQVIRFGFMLWLVLPQTQGASQLYVSHVQPFLSRHEHEVDRFIAQSHSNAKAMGVEYISRATHYLKQHFMSLVFGTEYREYAATPKPHSDADLAAATATESSSSTVRATTSYADLLFSRFRYPPSADGLSLSSLISPITGASSSILNTLQNVSVSIPSVKSKEEINELRTRLMSVVSSLDDRLKTIEEQDAPQHQQQQPPPPSIRSVSSAASLSTSTSTSNDETEFDMVKPEDATSVEEETSPKKGWFW